MRPCASCARRSAAAPWSRPAQRRPGPFAATLSLTRNPPTVPTIRAAFERLGFTLDLAGGHPASPLRLTPLGPLNHWRNTAARPRTPPRPPGMPGTLTHADL